MKMKKNIDIIERINIKTQNLENKSLEERIDRKTNPLFHEISDKKKLMNDSTLSSDVEGTGGTPSVSGSRIDKETKENFLSLIRFESTSYNDNPSSEYGLEDDNFGILGRRIDKKKGKWKRVEDEPNLELFFYTLDENKEDFTNEIKLSNKTSKQKKRKSKKYYQRNRIKILKKKRQERRKTLYKKQKEYRKNRNKKILTPTGRKKLKYRGTKNHLDK